jgi:hypothetical protein
MTHADRAADLVLGDRNADYGNPREDFAGVALVWSGLLADKLQPGAILTPRDVALMMAGYKLRRYAHKPKPDSITDAHGYLFCLEWIEGDARPKPLAHELAQKLTEASETIESVCTGERLDCPRCGQPMPCCCA